MGGFIEFPQQQQETPIRQDRRENIVAVLLALAKSSMVMEPPLRARALAKLEGTPSASGIQALLPHVHGLLGAIEGGSPVDDSYENDHRFREARDLLRARFDGRAPEPQQRSSDFEVGGVYKDPSGREFVVVNSEECKLRKVVDVNTGRALRPDEIDGLSSEKVRDMRPLAVHGDETILRERSGDLWLAVAFNRDDMTVYAKCSHPARTIWVCAYTGAALSGNVHLEYAQPQFQQGMVYVQEGREFVVINSEECTLRSLDNATTYSFRALPGLRPKYPFEYKEVIHLVDKRLVDTNDEELGLIRVDTNDRTVLLKNGSGDDWYCLYTGLCLGDEDYGFRAVDPDTQQTPQTPEPERKGKPMSLDPIAEMIWSQIKPLVSEAAVSEDMVNKLVEEAVAKVTSPIITVKNPPPAMDKEVPRQHYMFELVLRIMHAGVPLYLWGGAGSSKTSLLMACAEALELPCNVVSFSRDTTRSQMMGYITLNGDRAPSLIHDAFVNGKLLVMDEFDAGGVGQLCLNSLLANGVAEFYGEMAEAHENFFVSVTANTPGTGAANGYRREPVDAATRDRMFVLELPIDEGLEAHICGVQKESPKLDVGLGGILTPAEWHDLVAKYREAFTDLGIGTTLTSSMRPAKLGAILAASGVGRHWLEEGLIRRGMALDTWKKVKGALA